MEAVIYLAQSENYRNFPEKALDIFEINTAKLLKCWITQEKQEQRSLFMLPVVVYMDQHIVVFQKQQHCQPLEKMVFIYQVSFVLRC